MLILTWLFQGQKLIEQGIIISVLYRLATLHVYISYGAEEVTYKAIVIARHKPIEFTCNDYGTRGEIWEIIEAEWRTSASMNMVTIISANNLSAVRLHFVIPANFNLLRIRPIHYWNRTYIYIYISVKKSLNMSSAKHYGHLL